MKWNISPVIICQKKRVLKLQVENVNRKNNVGMDESELFWEQQLETHFFSLHFFENWQHLNYLE